VAASYRGSISAFQRWHQSMLFRVRNFESVLANFSPPLSSFCWSSMSHAFSQEERLLGVLTTGLDLPIVGAGGGVGGAWDGTDDDDDDDDIT